MSTAKVNNCLEVLCDIMYLTLHNRVSCDRLLQLKNAFILEVERLFEGFEELEGKIEPEEYISEFGSFQIDTLKYYSELGPIHLGDDNDNNYYMATSQIYRIVELLREKDIKEARVCQFMVVSYMESIVYNKCKCNPYCAYLIDKSYHVPANVAEN